MGQHSDKARQALLDAAEELFAKHGIDAISNRRITEHAGTANHSAIAYHFGGRDEMIHALLSRHLGTMRARRAELVAALGEDAGLRDVLACRILPWIEHLAGLPRPSWRARFLFQVRSVPSAALVLTDVAEEAADIADLGRHLERLMGGIDERIARARSGILGHVVLGICAEYEGRLENGTEQGHWGDVGYFLIDSAAGMLSAPVTSRADYIPQPSEPNLV